MILTSLKDFSAYRPARTRDFAEAINPLRVGLHRWAALPLRYRGQSSAYEDFGDQ